MHFLSFATRRAVLTSVLALTAQSRSLSVSAASFSADAALSLLDSARLKLSRADELIPDQTRWTEVETLLTGPEFQNDVLMRAFDTVVDPPTVKDRMMDQAAFIVYYEEKRYNDFRLEPQVPGRRAQQNGFKKDVLRAIADERAEIQFLRKSSSPSEEDLTDLKAYSAAALRALDDFLALTRPSAQQTR